MKKLILAAATALFCIGLNAQSTDSYKERYQRLSRILGPAGLGIETVLEEWKAENPDDRDLLKAGFNYYYTKCRKDKVSEMRGRTKYLGKKPVFELKDSTGTKVPYFTDYDITDSLFNIAIENVDKAIKLYPDEIDLRFGKIGALIVRDKENPEAAKQEILSLLEYDAKTKPAWKDCDTLIAKGEFEEQIQGCLFEIYRIGSSQAYEIFNTVAQKASKLFPTNCLFINDIGSYWLVAKNNPKKAIKYYEKALKINPEDQGAKANIAVAKKKMSQK